MAESYDHVISGLLRRRGDLLPETAQLRSRLAAIANEIDAIDRVLNGLSYKGELQDRDQGKTRLVLFYRNELRQFIQHELRKPGRPMTVREPAVILCQTEGKNAQDARMVRDVTSRISEALRQMRQLGLVKSAVGDRKNGCMWSLAAQESGGV
jgi:hypothetical protein